jgi:hypothetical protein
MPDYDGGSTIRSTIVTAFLSTPTSLVPVSSNVGPVVFPYNTPSIRYTSNLVVDNYYQFYAQVQNIAGISQPSALTIPFLIAVPPNSPVFLSVTQGTHQVTIAFNPGSSGAVPISYYTVYASPSIGQPRNIYPTSVVNNSFVITGLTNNIEYTFTMTATNYVGSSAVNNASPPVMPRAPKPLTNPQFPIQSWLSTSASFSLDVLPDMSATVAGPDRSEEHTSELQSHLCL